MNIKILSVPGLIFLISVILAVGTLTCNNHEQIINQEFECRIITEKINSVFGWAVNKDFNQFFNAIANDSDFISVTPYKRVKFGIDEVKKDTAFWASSKFKAISHDIKDLKIQISKSGKVAWFYCIVNDINEWDGQPANWENVSWTGVLEKRNNEWKVVQQHFSIASSN